MTALLFPAVTSAPHPTRIRPLRRSRCDLLFLAAMDLRSPYILKLRRRIFQIRCVCVWGEFCAREMNALASPPCIHDLRAASTERIVHVRAQRQIPVIMGGMPIRIQTLITSLLITSRVHSGVDLRPPHLIYRNSVATLCWACSVDS